jgi:predicted phage baseplate assembly protein
VASGNAGLAHHGRRVDKQVTGVVSNLLLDEYPVSHWQPSAGQAPVSELLEADPRKAKPAVAIEDWIRADSLLDSHPDDAHFVAEIDNLGRAAIRFGDGVAAKSVQPEDILNVTYHLGLGPLFDVSGNSLVHVIDVGAAPNAAVVSSVRNPLPAWGGAAPEPIEDVKLTAPASLRTGLFRAVTESDYAQAAEMMPEVSKAVATFRWTGSWHTVYVTVDPAGAADLTPELRTRVEGWVRRFLQTGYDLEINSPVYVPLEIEAVICTDSEHFRTDVYQSLLRALGRTAFFDPDRHTFGQPLYLSQLYAEITKVEGVRSAKITRFQRFGKASQGELDAGVIRASATEVIRCDNDPNFAERGVLKIQMEGGK